VRDEYHEFCQLCLVFLDDEVAGKEIKFKQPGALRWMAKLLYSFKICLFEEQIRILPAGTIASSSQLKKLRNFITFAALVYSPWWMTCSSAANAPWSSYSVCYDMKL
jgi:hypothetical protein